MIKKFIQTENNPELFSLIGNYIVSKKVHDELGTAITTNEDDKWFVKIVKNKAVAFLTMREMKNGAVHIRFVYGSQSDKKELITETINSYTSCKIWTNDRETEILWSELEFNMISKARGSFCRWERENKDD